MTLVLGVKRMNGGGQLANDADEMKHHVAMMPSSRGDGSRGERAGARAQDAPASFQLGMDAAEGGVRTANSRTGISWSGRR